MTKSGLRGLIIILKRMISDSVSMYCQIQMQSSERLCTPHSFTGLDWALSKLDLVESSLPMARLELVSFRHIEAREVILMELETVLNPFGLLFLHKLQTL